MASEIGPITTEEEATRWLDAWDHHRQFEVVNADELHDAQANHDGFLTYSLPVKIVNVMEDMCCGRFVDALYTVTTYEEKSLTAGTIPPGCFGRDADTLRRMAELLARLQTAQARYMRGDLVGTVEVLRGADSVRLPGFKNGHPIWLCEADDVLAAKDGEAGSTEKAAQE